MLCNVCMRRTVWELVTQCHTKSEETKSVSWDNEAPEGFRRMWWKEKKFHTPLTDLHQWDLTKWEAFVTGFDSAKNTLSSLHQSIKTLSLIFKHLILIIGIKGNWTIHWFNAWYVKFNHYFHVCSNVQKPGDQTSSTLTSNVIFPSRTHTEKRKCMFCFLQLSS